MRCELGYPIIVSPFAQFVMTQAVLNVMGKERYATVPDEVRKYVLGYYGEIAGPIEPNIFDRITKGAEPIKARPGDLLEPGIDTLRRERGPFRVRRRSAAGRVLCRTANTTRSKAAGPIKTEYPLASTPLHTLVKEIALRPGHQIVPFLAPAARIIEERMLDATDHHHLLPSPALCRARRRRRPCR